MCKICRNCKHASLYGYIEKKAHCKVSKDIILDIDLPPDTCKYKKNEKSVDTER
jgi:hypothetical protein